MCGFACLAQALGLSQRWCELHGTATLTSDVFLCQLERELSDPPARDATSDFLDHVTWTLPKLDDRGVARFADAVLASASAPADKAAPLLCDEARLGAEQRHRRPRAATRSLTSPGTCCPPWSPSGPGSSRRENLDLAVSQAPGPPERGRAAGIDELRAALSDLSCLGVDLCSVAAASAYGTLGDPILMGRATALSGRSSEGASGPLPSRDGAARARPALSPSRSWRGRLRPWTATASQALTLALTFGRWSRS